MRARCVTQFGGAAYAELAAKHGCSCMTDSLAPICARCVTQFGCAAYAELAAKHGCSCMTDSTSPHVCTLRYTIWGCCLCRARSKTRLQLHGSHHQHACAYTCVRVYVCVHAHVDTSNSALGCVSHKEVSGTAFTTLPTCLRPETEQ